ncbi:MAG: motility associated factor glycosyltransferase family protein [Brevinematales bacterium]|nr:motility associated factor glycosyltransferase family protein [Brevinematales bacterium]
MINRIKLEMLSRRNRAIVRTRDGGYSLEIGGLSVHSLYSPEKEAARLIEEILPLEKDSTLVIVLGAGLGYHIELLEQNGFKNIIVIERSPEIYGIFKDVYEFGFVPGIIAPDDPVEKLDSYFTALQIEQFKHIKTLVLRGGYDKESYSRFENRIERLLKVRLGDFATRLKFEENWFINILRNINHLGKSARVGELTAKHIGAPIVIVSAGPSLRDSMPMLREIRDYVFMIAVDTALLALYEAGIAPDLVYTLDSQVHNLGDFLMIPRSYMENIGLVYDLVANSALPEFFPGRLIAANTAHLDYDPDGKPFLQKNELVHWMENTGGIAFGDIETGGSVATSAFHFAFLAGAAPILITGQDLAYSYYASHCSSTPHFYRIGRMNNRLVPIMSTFLKVMKSREVFLAPGTNGKVYTDFLLNNYKGWFEESAKSILKNYPGFPLINATANGVIINGFLRVEQGELIRQLKKGDKVNKTDFLKSLNLIDSKSIGKILEGLEGLKGFAAGLSCDETVFETVRTSDFGFLNRYLMREKVIFERYGNFEKFHMERKLYRLIKNLEGIFHAAE